MTANDKWMTTTTTEIKVYVGEGGLGWVGCVYVCLTRVNLILLRILWLPRKCASFVC